MGYGIGSILSLVVAVFARIVGLDRDRAFYTTVLIVVGSYYVLYATIGGSTQALILELIAMAVFVTVAVIGFKFNMWFVAAGLTAHGIFDFFHSGFIDNAGVPHWWPAFCMSYDIGAGGILAWLLLKSKSGATKPS